MSTTVITMRLEAVLRGSRQLLALLGLILIIAGIAQVAMAGSIPNSIGGLTVPRAGAAATLLPNGKILIAGGYNNVEGFLSGAELYDPANKHFGATGRMRSARGGATAMLLNNGKVLIVGGSNFDEEILGSAELYDPATGAFTEAGHLAVARHDYAIAKLANGQVLLAGGTYNRSHSARGPKSEAASRVAELYDPATGAFRATGDMVNGRYAATASLLSDGRVLIVGGEGKNGDYDGYLSTAEIYDPATGSFSTSGTMTVDRAGASAILLPNRQVLIVGGGGNSPGDASPELYNPTDNTFAKTNHSAAEFDYALAKVALLPSGKVLIVRNDDDADTRDLSVLSELYDPATETFTESGRINIPRFGASVSALPDGEVLIFGGIDAGGNYLSSAELYDPACGKFALSGRHESPSSDAQLAAGSKATGALEAARYGATATLLSNGKVLVAGGTGAPSSPDGGGGAPLAGAELYDPAAGKFADAGSMTTARSSALATRLSSDQVLIVGGDSSSCCQPSSAELYDPNTRRFTATGMTLSIRRSGATITRLTNGNVLIAGGVGTNSTASLSSAEIYDAGKGTFAVVGNMTSARAYATATLLSDGKVLIVGGFADGDVIDGRYLNNTELYDPQTGVFTVTGSLKMARAFAAATRLRNGNVLIVGGRNSYTPLASAELYDTSTGMFRTTGPLITAHESADGLLLSSGEVLVWGVGPYNAELYNPVDGTFAKAADPATMRWGSTTTLLSDGKVLIAGGNATPFGCARFDDPYASAEIYDPANRIVAMHHFSPPKIASVGGGCR
jgi:large repetitive protein